MANLRTDALTSRRIVKSFFDFLDSVEPAPGVDLEGLDVAKDCLTEVFGLDQLPEIEWPEPNLLMEVFSSQEQSAKSDVKAGHSVESCGRASTHDCADGGSSETSKVENHKGVEESYDTVVAKDELFGYFFDALEKIHFFRTTPNGDDDHDLLDRATSLFHDAVDVMEKSGCKTFDRKNLADALKILGNKAMQSKEYSDAIERYTCAIALCENNAVYYCNRAAAYTQIRRYNEAIQDCLKSIRFDSNYSKAYSRLGLAYYAQGNYSDAINKGFRKALELDPNNDAVKENIQVAEQKLREQQEQRHRHQDPGNHFPGGSGNQAAPPPYASMSFDMGTLPPANFTSMFSNIAGNASRDQNGPSRPPEDNSGTHYSSSSTRSFDSTAFPPDIANVFMNMTGNAFPGQNSQSNGSRGAHQFTSMPFDASAFPSDLPGMFMNMTGQQGQPQGGSNTGGFDDPGIGNISLNLGEQTTEEVTRTLRSVMGMFSEGVQGDPHGNHEDGRSGPS